MENSQPSDELLARYERPKMLEMPDFEWVDDVIPLGTEADAGHGIDLLVAPVERFIELPRDTRRGVLWVLTWAGAFAAVSIAAGLLTEFAYVLAAERTLT